MKHLLLLFTLLSFGRALATDLDFVLHNETSRSFEAVYISASDNKDWDGNLLTKSRVLAAGGKLTVQFDKKAGTAAWDINVVDDEGLVVKFDHVNLTNVETITLQDVNGKITAVVE